MVDETKEWKYRWDDRMEGKGELVDDNH